MNFIYNLQDRILNGTNEDFLPLALEVFEYQSKNNSIYAEYLKLLKKQNLKPKSLEEIPFLPTSVFKSRTVKSGGWMEEIVFESSGTTVGAKSRHYIKSLDWYQQVSRRCFEYHYGQIENYNFIGLLPSLSDAPASSLVTMFWNFASHAGMPIQDISYLRSQNEFYDALLNLENVPKITVILGLSFALLDFVLEYKIHSSNLIVIETGGMKNSNRQIDKNNLLSKLISGFPNAQIHSEYGMTELMSQAYAKDGVHYSFAPIMKVLISDPTDPFQFLESNKRGIINIIDLGNLHSCSFLQTGDLGMLNDLGQFKIYGRYQPEDMRGCAQMYEPD